MNVKSGRLEVITGPMFSGKTEELIRRVRCSEKARKNVQVLKPAIDGRHGAKAEIVSHDKSILRATLVENYEHFKIVLNYGMHGYAFDEFQFFDGRVFDDIFELYSEGKNIVVAGLNQNYKGEPFKLRDSDRHIGDLLVIADDPVILTAECDYLISGNERCGVVATRTQRIVKGNDLILVGGKEKYEPRCSKHHFVEHEQKIHL